MDIVRKDVSPFFTGKYIDRTSSCWTVNGNGICAGGEFVDGGKKQRDAEDMLWYTWLMCHSIHEHHAEVINVINCTRASP